MINIAARKQEVQILVESLAGTTLGQVDAGEAVITVNVHGTGLLQSYLMKKVRASIVVTGITAPEGDHMVVGMARGDASVSEIATAIRQTQLERDRVSQAQRRIVLHETLTLLKVSGNIDNRLVAEIDMSLGGGRGIPFEDGDGWAWFIFNVHDDVVATGGNMSVQATYWGIWL